MSDSVLNNLIAQLEFLSNYALKDDTELIKEQLQVVVNNVFNSNKYYAITVMLAQHKLTDYRCDKWEDYYIVLPNTCGIVTHVDPINKLISILNQGDLLMCMVGIGPTEDLAWFNAYDKLIKL